MTLRRIAAAVLLVLLLPIGLASTAEAQSISIPATRAFTETDSDTDHTLSVSGSPGSGNEGYLTFFLAAGTHTALGYRSSVLDFTCRPNDDYVADIDSLPYVNGDRFSSSYTSTLTVCGDDEDEPNETFALLWQADADIAFFDANADHCTSNSRCTTTYTIVDDDPTTVWLRGLVMVDVCKLSGSGVPASVCESDNNSPERKQCEAAWTPAWAKPGAISRAQVSQADINAARASVAAICNYNSSAVYVQERHGRDEITIKEGGSDAEIIVGLSRKLVASEMVTVPLTVSGANITASDYMISLKSGTGINTGVALDTSAPRSAAEPAVVFTGHATDEVRFASLLVQGVRDGNSESAETLTLGMSNVTSNLDRLSGTGEGGTKKHGNYQTAKVTIDGVAPMSLSAPVVQEPTEAVANVRVTAVDDASVLVTWDAVEHATAYEVSWEAESSDSQNAIAGIEPRVMGTSATISHNVPAPMTLTVTVTPEYVDEDGDTYQFDDLAGTATLVACVSDELLADVDARIKRTGLKRWTRVKNALTGQPNAITLAKVENIYESRAQKGRSTDQWEPVIEAMECLEAENQ